MMFDFHGGKWRPRYAGLRFPLLASYWLPRRMPTADGRTLADPLAFVPTLAGWTLNRKVEFLLLIRLEVCVDYLCSSLEKSGMCSFQQTTPMERSLIFPQSNNQNPYFFLSPLFYTHWAKVTYSMLI